MLKRAIFPKVKESEHLSGDVVLYAAQSNVLNDTEIGKKGRFRAEITDVRGTSVK